MSLLECLLIFQQLFSHSLSFRFVFISLSYLLKVCSRAYLVLHTYIMYFRLSDLPS